MHFVMNSALWGGMSWERYGYQIEREGGEMESEEDAGQVKRAM